MHVVLGILGVLGALTFWYYRMKYISEATSEVADVVGRIQGQFRTAKLKKKAGESPITSIGEPIVAAAALMISIAELDDPLSEPEIASIRDQLSELTRPDAVEEAYVYARWATEQVIDTNNVILRLKNMLNEKLNSDERRELLAMVTTAAQAGGDLNDEQIQAIATLNRSLNLS
ncbi:TerB family tellurite resistance protein [Anderseniella sp. Alg231-50]|uniref:TerB family tellurite resistance protein n=1 Tax=Anderseniella sp. Alg231-50 TaxID=1922226 RepID=UPI000D55098F